MTPDAKESRTVAALSYVFILFLIPLGKRNSPFCQFHAKQGMVLLAAWIIIGLLGWVPFLGWALWLSALIVNIMAIVKTLNGEMWELPWLGKYAKRIKI